MGGIRALLRAAWVAGVVIALPLAVLGGTAYARAAGGPVRPAGTSVPVPAGLSAVSCPAAGNCLAVGGQAAASWNGHSWAPMATPVGLSSISCASTVWCMAVGGKDAATWNGHSWQPVTVPDPGPGFSLSAVSCASVSACMAVGQENFPNGPNTVNAVAERWNGKTWTVTLPPSGDCSYSCTFYGVSCVKPFQCMAVGLYQVDGNYLSAYGEWWTGTTWSLQNPAGLGSGDDELFSASCTSSSSCMVGGSSNGSPAAYLWNGSSWQQLSPQGTNALAGLSCPAANSCIAVGAGPQAQAWNGSSWQALAPVDPGDGAGLSGVSCATVSACMTVGQSPDLVALAEQWNGTSFALTKVFSIDRLAGTVCPLITGCLAVGSYITSSDAVAALAERWDGHQWHTLFPLDPGPHITSLSAVYCTAVTTCMTVGSYRDAQGVLHGLAESWNGTTWKVLPLPTPPGTDAGMNTLSCPRTNDCIALGAYITNPDYPPLTIADIWNGSTWRAVTPPNPGGSFDLTGISCTSTANCMAVGTRTSGTLAEHWNGSTWSIIPTPRPPGSELISVACRTPQDCVAVGTTSMIWNGKTWQVVPTVNPRGLLVKVSCATTTSCLAAGQRAGAVLTEQWNGHGWQNVTTPAISGALAGLSCTPRANCIAVGQTTTERTIGLLWNGQHWQQLTTTNP